MRELPEPSEARAAWLNQPEEDSSVDLERHLRRRTWELFSTTRSEIIASAVAALFFAGIVAWRVAPEGDRLAQYGCVAIVAWAAVTIYRFRRSMLRSAPQADALARTGLAHYREELLRRRDHLRSAWVWHGPLVLAVVISAAATAERFVPGRLREAMPLILLLAAWVAFGIRRRRRQAADLQREIDEIGESPETRP